MSDATGPVRGAPGRVHPLLPIPGPIGRGLESLYRLGVALDTRRKTASPPHRLPVPVISVGNITVGGTGKTPVVEAIARTHRDAGGRPGILSRGYRGGEHGNDESLLLARRLPDVPHVADADRRSGGAHLLAEHPDVDLIILDDGFQHRRLARDVDLVLIDALRPFGGGRCLPAGLLREPWESLERADAILVTRAEQADPELLSEIDRLLAERFPRAWRGCARRVVEGIHDLAGRPVDAGRRRVAAFCGIGNPAAFFASIGAMGHDIVLERRFPDHHRYRGDDVVRLAADARAAGADLLVTTEKDGVKLSALPAATAAEPAVAEVRIRAEFPVAELLGLLPPLADGGRMRAPPAGKDPP